MRKLLTCCLCVLASCSSQHAPPRSKPANCGKTAPIASDFHKADPIEGVGLPPEVFVNLESGAISPRGVDASPLTLQFQLVRSGPAELDGLQFDVSDDIYISRYELSNYQLWYLCNVIGPERWTFDDWSKNRMERFAAWGKLGKSSEAAMRAYCEQPDLPALCVNSVELQQLHFNAKHRWLLDLWIPSVGQWVKMASAGRGARQNLDALIQAKAVKWQGWRLKDAAQLDCLVPVRSTLHGGAEIGGFVDVFGGASEMVHVTKEEAVVLESVVDRLATRYQRSRWNYKGLFVPERGFLAMGGSFEEVGAGATSESHAIRNFVEQTTDWEKILGHQLNGSMRWQVDRDWAVGLRLAMSRTSLAEAMIVGAR